jgi:hypothetical protein
MNLPSFEKLQGAPMDVTTAKKTQPSPPVQTAKPKPSPQVTQNREIPPKPEQTRPAQQNAPRPVINTQGQTTGQRLNAVA